MKRKTKILATIGPASDTIETLESLISEGVNVFRMNFSHGSHESHSHVLSNIRKASENTGKIVGVLQDLCGPKIRVKELNEDFMLQKDDTLYFHLENIVGYRHNSNEYHLSINQPEILKRLAVDDLVYLYDGNIRTVVTAVEETRVVARVENNGKLSSNKGVNFPNTKLGISVLTEKDRNDLKWGIENGVDFVALSFVQSAEDVIEAKELIHALGGDQKLFAKIEKFDAVEQIDSIIEASDGIMVARGDLGIEVPYFKVPTIQKSIIRKANEASIPVITATQMLLSMTEKETATRAEISDVANAVLDGTDCVMLSEESAIGKNPVKTVQTMINTIVATEQYYPYHQYGNHAYHDETDIIAASTTRLADDLKATSILSLTSSGSSARKMARYRPDTDIFAVTHDVRTARSLTISWGVTPLTTVAKNSLHLMLSELLIKCTQEGSLDAEGIYIATAGHPVGVPGSTNFIRILRQKEIEYYINSYAEEIEHLFD